MSSKKLESNNFESMNEFKDTLLYGKLLYGTEIFNI